MLATWAFLIGLVVMGDTNTDPESYSMIVPDGPISAPLGASITLPCSVSPAFSVVAHKIRWYRPNKFDTPILLYENRKVQKDPSDVQYRGRVSLVGALDQGNVSMRLDKLTLADRGEYVCYVHSTVWFEEGTVSVIAEVVGTLPVLSVSSGEEDKVNVTCMSEGWSPQPTLTWTGGGGESITLYHTVYSTGEQGLVRVSSWLLHSPSESEWLSCSVGLSDQDRREGRVVPYVYTTHKGAVIGIVISVVVVLILVPVIVFLYRKGVEAQKQKQEKEKEIKDKDEEMELMKGGLQKELVETTSRLLKEKAALKDVLTRLHEQICDTTRQLTTNEGTFDELKKTISGTLRTLQLQKDQEPLNQLLTRLDNILHRGLKKDTKGLQKVLKDRQISIKSRFDLGREREDHQETLLSEETNISLLGLQKDIQGLKKEIDTFETRLEKEIQGLQKVLKDKESVKKSRTDIGNEREGDVTLAKLQMKLDEIKTSAANLEKQVFQIHLEYQSEETRRLKEQKEGLERCLKVKTSEAETLKQQKEGLESNLGDKTNEIQALQQDKQGLERCLEVKTSEAETLKQQKEDLQKLLSGKTCEAETLQQQNEDMERRLEVKTSEAGTLKRQTEGLERRLEVKTSEAETLKQQKEGLEKQLEEKTREAETQIKDLEKRLRDKTCEADTQN